MKWRGMKKNNKRKYNPAFTLIELLVVVAIIAVLAVVVIISFSDARAKSRDSKRVSDLNAINSALVQFVETNNKILDGACSNGTWTVNDVLLNHYLVPAYLPVMPKDPKTPNSDYYNQQYIYETVKLNGANYAWSQSATCSTSTGATYNSVYYALQVSLEVDNSPNANYSQYISNGFLLLDPDLNIMSGDTRTIENSFVIIKQL